MTAVACLATSWGFFFTKHKFGTIGASNTIFPFSKRLKVFYKSLMTSYSVVMKGLLRIKEGAWDWPKTTCLSSIKGSFVIWTSLISNSWAFTTLKTRKMRLILLKKCNLLLTKQEWRHPSQKPSSILCPSSRLSWLNAQIQAKEETSWCRFRCLWCCQDKPRSGHLADRWASSS